MNINYPTPGGTIGANATSSVHRTDTSKYYRTTFEFFEPDHTDPRPLFKGSPVRHRGLFRWQIELDHYRETGLPLFRRYPSKFSTHEKTKKKIKYIPDEALSNKRKNFFVEWDIVEPVYTNMNRDPQYLDVTIGVFMRLGGRRSKERDNHGFRGKGHAIDAKNFDRFRFGQLIKIPVRIYSNSVKILEKKITVDKENLHYGEFLEDVDEIPFDVYDDSQYFKVDQDYYSDSDDSEDEELKYVVPSNNRRR